MSEIIYSHIGVNEEDLNAEHTAIFNKGDKTYISDFIPQYNPDLIINMPFIGKGENADTEFLKQLYNEKPEYIYKRNETAIKENNVSKLSNKPQGWYRDHIYYFMCLKEKHPDAFSTDSKNGNKNNTWRIENNLSPIVDPQFVEYFDMYEDCLGEGFQHHHIGRDGQCVALPQSIHLGSGGIHSVEEDIGVTYNAEKHSDKVQEALDANYIQSGDDVWSELENGTEL